MTIEECDMTKGLAFQIFTENHMAILAEVAFDIKLKRIKTIQRKEDDYNICFNLEITFSNFEDFKGFRPNKIFS